MPRFAALPALPRWSPHAAPAQRVATGTPRLMPPLPSRKRQVSCAAGFLRTPEHAQRVANELRQLFALDNDQVRVLAPGSDAREATPGHAGAGASGLFNRPGALAAALAWLMAALVPSAGRSARFTRAVQGRLRRGDWAVVLNSVPPAQQADVMTMLRCSSRSWCAVAPLQRRL